MARINPGKRLMTVKVVYYGPGLCGKTTNLLYLHEAYPERQRGPLVKLDTETERTLFFDYFPASLGSVAGYALKADFFTVPGQSFYNSTRKAVLDGADGIVFVADSSPDREEANLDALDNMRENLAAYGRAHAEIPLVFQWNKRDVAGALPVALLEKQLNPGGEPCHEAVAVRGKGVWETQQEILRLVLEDLRSRAREGRLRA